MRNQLGGLVVVLLAACGKEESTPDLTKMEPEAACAMIQAQVYQCRETIVSSFRKEMEAAGAPEREIASMAEAMSEMGGDRCEGMTRGAIASISSCFSKDCGKLATCMKPLLLEGMREAGPE
jgi:hypothetical protein